MVKFICNRCGADITNGKEFGKVEVTIFKNNDFEGAPEWLAGKSADEHFCRECAEAVARFMYAPPAAAVTTVKVAPRTGTEHLRRMMRETLAATAEAKRLGEVIKSPGTVTNLPVNVTESPDTITETPEKTTKASKKTTKAHEKITESPEEIPKSPEIITDKPAETTEPPEAIKKEYPDWMQLTPSSLEPYEDEIEKPRKRNPIDYGKIAALRNAGWGNKEIADEMGMTRKDVATAICKCRKRGLINE
ncbi:MAG: hypothetical protein NC092_04580 [Butyrivibrio sp.]|nr:hypothetical protein [Muribaculum sp.]MCM1551950.1 hypothetical protein [Butyrivibrio sp.]